MKTNRLLHPLWVPLIACSAAAAGAEPQTPDRGRYLLIAGGCNDCHTPGYMQGDGKVPENVWLTGSSVGFQGPWGTTYPANLRLYAQSLSEAGWIERVRQPMRPPMPWFNLREMTDADLGAMYRYLRELGPAGAPAPAAAAPGAVVTTPYIDFTPKNLPQQQVRNDLPAGGGIVR